MTAVVEGMVVGQVRVDPLCIKGVQHHRVTVFSCTLYYQTNLSRKHLDYGAGWQLRLMYAYVFSKPVALASALFAISIRLGPLRHA